MPPSPSITPIPNVPDVLDIENQTVAEEKQADVNLSQLIRGHFYNAIGMSVGTGAWMGVYYLEPYFRYCAPVNYPVHCVAMGTFSNLAAMPFVRQAGLTFGEDPQTANKRAKTYFTWCFFPDTFYLPVSDGVVAWASANSFAPYADTVFTPAEIGAGFAAFGVGFSLLFYGIDRALHYHEEEENTTVEENIVRNSVQEGEGTLFLIILKKMQAVLATSEWDAFKSGLQYFLFYYTDYFFDTDIDMDEPGPGARDLWLSCFVMGFYSFIIDSLPDVLAAIEKKYYPIILPTTTASNEEAAHDSANPLMATTQPESESQADDTDSEAEDDAEDEDNIRVSFCDKIMFCMFGRTPTYTRLREQDKQSGNAPRPRGASQSD
jgi:hypothetical protein